ncbi:helix-turn-helix domain-containing protein [Ferrimonas balearica]|uniref:helix-turn-helix domain-containing protein n=1 Tax=Ferrimonas balearica TaxID=44012 RepID=UPI001F3E300C|nr:hypothetical protein [Ferrimonas balearica]MBY6095292.1 hypothetical protein [Ferrimonas balearica]
MSRVPCFANTEEAQILCHLRDVTGMDTRQLAAFMCTTPETIRRWQRGSMRARGPALGLLRVLAMNTDWTVRDAIMIGKLNRQYPVATESLKVVNLVK